MGVGLELGSYFLSASSLCIEVLLLCMDYVVSLTGNGMLQAVWLHPGILIVALLTTAAGLIVAIPALVMHRYYTGLIDTIVVDQEREAIKLVDAIHNGAGQDYTA